ncbi:MAG: ABC transporter ATP-binding protein/permease [Phycisphaerales bacterium]|nr:ABC transporter ATP-binding protein/permease [Phycisphaerales bacterium]
MNRHPFGILWPSIKAHRRDLSIALGAAFVAQVTGLALPLLTRWLINRAAVPPIVSGPGTQTVWLFVVVTIALVLSRAFLQWLQVACGERGAQEVIADVRSQMYRKVQELSAGYFDRRPSGKIIVRFVGDANALRTWLARTIVSIPGDVLTIAIVLIVVGFFHIELLAAILIPLAFIVPVLIFVNPHTRFFTRQGRNHQSRLCGLLSRRITALSATKAANAQDQDAIDVQALIDSVASANVRRGRLDAWARSASIASTTAALGTLGLWGAHLLSWGQINHGDLIAALWLTLLVRVPAIRLARANIMHQRARVAMDRIAALLDRKSERGWESDAVAYLGPGQTIKFRHVGYKNAGGAWVMRDVTATIHGPGLVAVTDETGRAKSAFLELLLRIRRPHAGRIYLDGLLIRKLRVADVRRQMGWVDRDRHNIEVVRMLSRCHAVSRTDQFEKAWRLTTDVAPDVDSDRAMRILNPSNDHRGLIETAHPDEKLRITLTCSLIYDPPILLLDEPGQDLGPSSINRLVNWLINTSERRLIIVATNDARVVSACAERIHLPLALCRRNFDDPQDAKTAHEFPITALEALPGQW